MAVSPLHKRKCVVVSMNILDELNVVDKCLDNIALKSVSSSGKQDKSIATWVHHGKNSVEKIKKYIKSVSDNLTIRVHSIMSHDTARPLPAEPTGNKRCSVRHVQNIRKRKFAELDAVTIKSSLTDLWQSGKLQRPEDVCKLIHGDDSPEYKRKRRVIYNVLCDELKVCTKKTLHNKYTQYVRSLRKEGPPLPERFGATGKPLMPTALFLSAMKEEIKSLNEHQQKDLRTATQKVLTTHMRSGHNKSELSSVIHACCAV